MTTHDDIQADLAAYALDALDAAERGAVDEHLATGCVACTRELAHWREVVATMALADRPATAPDLKPLLLQQLRPTPRRARVVELRRLWPLPLAAAALVLLGLVMFRDHHLRGALEQQHQVVANLRTDLGDVREQLARATAELSAKEHDLAVLRAALASAQESLSVLQAPGLQLVHLSRTPDAPAVEAHALISQTAHRALVYGFDLPPVPADKTYELWWITEKQGPVNAGLFRPDQRGLGRIEAVLPTDAGAIQAAAVTVEPASGVPKPTGPMVLLGQVSTS